MTPRKIARIDELKASGKLPSPAGVGLQIIELTEKQDVSAEEISNIVKNDPALTGRLLKYANSAYVGFKAPTLSIKQAIIRLGIRTTYRLILGFSVIKSSHTNKCLHFDFHQFWSQSLAKAVCAFNLCKSTNLIPPDDAFTCGLLSGVGNLGLANVHPKKYDTLLAALAIDPSLDIFALEIEAFDITHTDLTEALLREWRIPDLAIMAIRKHEHLYEDDASPYEDDAMFAEVDIMPAENAEEDQRLETALARILRLSLSMARIFTAPAKQHESLMPELKKQIEDNGFTMDSFNGLWETSVQHWNDWGEVFEIGTQAVPDLQALTEQPKQTEETPHVPADGQDRLPSQNDWQESPAIEQPGPTHKPAKDSAAMPQTDYPLKILVVDDDPSDLNILSSLLTYAGHKVTTAKNGKKALQVALTHRPQVIVTDWMMPELNGLELCKALRRAEETNQIYVIMLTGCEDENHILQAFDSGADDYVVKPFQPRTMLARVQAAERVVVLQHKVIQDQEKIQNYLAELSVLNRRLEKAALTDLLTVMPNRRYAMHVLKNEWAYVLRNKKTLSCLMADVDNFKGINDSYGHNVGDIVLKKTAAIIKNSIRESDVACRFGGEEFLIICRETDLKGAHLVANRICENLRQTPIIDGAVNIKVTISIGAYQNQPGMKSHDNLLKSADEALYKAKENGRDQVWLADPIPQA